MNLDEDVMDSLVYSIMAMQLCELVQLSSPVILDEEMGLFEVPVVLKFKMKKE